MLNDCLKFSCFSKSILLIVHIENSMTNIIMNIAKVIFRLSTVSKIAKSGSDPIISNTLIPSVLNIRSDIKLGISSIFWNNPVGIDNITVIIMPI